MNVGTDATKAKYFPTADVTETRASEVASVEGNDDVILMTGEKTTINVVDGVTQQEAISGTKNQAKLTVERAVARVVVTKGANDFEIKGDNPMTNEKDETVLATLTNITYTVAQGEQTFNFVKINHTEKGMTQDAEAAQDYEKTPAFEKKTTANDNFWADASIKEYQALIEYYDYSGLWLNEHKGIEVKSRDAFLNPAAKETEEIGKVTSHITAKTGGDHGLFLLPTTHKYGATADESDYRKSNTAYILVRGTLNPKVYVNAAGKFETGTALDGKDFYLGANGVVYADSACVQNPDKGGVKGQTAQLYKKGKALYFVWVHPDKLAGTLNSPVDRNNIYHVQLKGVASWGANWNPLVPYPTDTPKIDPKTGKITEGPDKGKFPKNPNNPDDRPNDNHLEPKNPPVNPNENITPKETWMAAEVTILPWAVHSYEHILK